jgi:hypothetical protein
MDEDIFKNMIFAGGPPRSGTTLLARLLNAHPRIMVVADNSRLEYWGVYYYRSREGLVAQLRDHTLTPERARHYLAEKMVRKGYVWGAATSSSRYPRVPPPPRPDQHLSPWTRLKKLLKFRLAMMQGRPFGQLQRRRVPLTEFVSNYRLCLKSPEIVFVLPQLAQAFPQTRFVLVFRSVLAVAESMYRKGQEWKLDSYHRRWAKEKDKAGSLIPPPGVPPKWYELWQTVTDFQRCVIYAASYLRALLGSAPLLPKDKLFLYAHQALRRRPEAVLQSMATFLQIDVEEMYRLVPLIQAQRSERKNDFAAAYDDVAMALRIAELENQASKLASR